jgi:NAD(P)-dependent dehydrogenase (short-subunit alcohol dehydrogenase family)
MTHAALVPGAVAVITGGASGIGLAAAKRFTEMGLRVCVADLGAERLAAAAAAIGGETLTVETDVTRIEDLEALEAAARARFGSVDVLMLNAGIQPGSEILGTREAWDRIIATNLMGVVRGAQVFLPAMLTQEKPGLVIATGSKQGITTPPGDPAYNVAKAGVKAFTEALAHDLRERAGCAISAHLLIPGFVFTPLAAGGRTEKPGAAWTPEQTIDFMLTSLDRGDFYILCPDNDVHRGLDERRIAWAAGDVIENRPALSRWHPDYAEAFAAFVKGGE